ncbi:unnamed protein product [Moneuplotes crassus]|uniref:Uncharacterized protein n=1 Tax=Euplotes crassus TaxID=5936 RepID=A0AAD1Y2T8_EUPCR|nr:unnamed protein product [Moneuplotes crassus]
MRIKEMENADPEELLESRKGQVDKHCTFITFRDSRLKKKGLLTLVNEFDQFLLKRGMSTEAFYKIDGSKVAVCTPQLSDMMELKEIAAKESSVYIVDSGGETKLGAYIDKKEKDEFYSQFKPTKGKGRKKKRKTRKKATSSGKSSTNSVEKKDDL